MNQAKEKEKTVVQDGIQMEVGSSQAKKGKNKVWIYYLILISP